MRKKCRVISVLLVICLVISMLPVHAIATEADGEAAVFSQVTAASGERMTEQEPNNNKQQATHIPQGFTTVDGYLWRVEQDADDFFVFTVPARAMIDLTVEGLSGDLVIIVDGGGMGVREYIGDGWYRYTIQSEAGYLHVLDAGTYYIRIFTDSEDYIPYTIYLEMDVCEHTDKTGTTVEPTCTEDGYIHYVCADCNGAWDEKNADALGHTAVNSKVTGPTCPGTRSGT